MTPTGSQVLSEDVRDREPLCPSPAWHGWWDDFEDWCAHGRLPGERPASLPTSIPTAAFACYRRRHPKPPPPEPVSSLPFPGVAGPGVFFGGSFKNEAQTMLDVAYKRFQWAALLADALPSDPGAAIGAMHGMRRRCGVWDARVEFDSAARAARGWDFYIGQVEGPNQYDRVAQNILPFRLEHPTMPAAVVTNFGGLSTPALAEPFIDAGFACLVEVEHATGQSIPAQLAYAINTLGWPADRVAPVVELDQGATIADYPGWDACPGASVFTWEAYSG